MNDYRLDKTGQEVDNILNGAAMQTDLTAETERAELAEQTLQGNIDNEVLARQGAVSDEETRAKAAEKANADNITLAQQAIEAILLLIPSAATALNQLADKLFVNSSISTATATFRGTYNLVKDLSLSLSATHQQIGAALAGAIATADNNDYAFVQIPTSVDTPTEIAVTERYKFNGSVWEYEYDLNNSGFTSAQWEAINSGITALLVTKLGALPTAAELATALNGKQNVLTFDNVPVSGSDNPVKSGGLYTLFEAIDAMTPTGAGTNNKLVAEDRLTSYVTGIINALDATFDLTSADGHVTFKMTQADGLITSVQILTSDIASASQVSTNTADIAALQAAYAGLTQSDIVIVSGALPSSGQQQNVIYRQPDPDHTPPQFYSDYMWNGTTWVLMGQYNNAIDPRPKKGSQNIVTSGGVFDNIGALDISELNATENPHTLATYADLSAAIAAIPSDYQKGGMSIKFVQTSDNKYVQYKYMGTDVTGTPNPFLDTNNWSFCGNDVLINNSTWLEVVIDGGNKILYGVKKDGKVYFGDGCPPQVQEYVQEYVMEGLLGKVDKVTGKSLINTDVASSQDVVNNPKWLEVVTDNEGRVLEGITKDFKKTIFIPTEFSVLPNGILPYIVVDKSGKGHYTTLTEATDESPDGSTILVMPGLYDDEVITAGITKTLFIIGVDRDKCIIQNNYGLYEKAPINMASGLLRNLTIKNTATTRHGESQPSYAIHSDFEPMLNSTFRIENCTITSSMEAFPVIGVGLRGGSNGGALIISGCLIESISQSGCLLCHDNPGSHAADGLQRLVVTDCILNNNSNEVGSAVHITSMGCVDRTFNDTQFYIEFVRNRVFGRVIFRNYYEDDPEYLGEITQDDFQGIKNLRLSKLSWGNSASVLNNID